jgi:hypothetical protein
MLSPTIYFFYDIRNDLVRNASERNDKLTKKEFAHHIVSSSIFVMNEIAIANKIRELNSQNSFRFYIFEKTDRLKIGEIGPYNLDANIVRSNAHKILLTFVKHELIYFDAYLSALSSFKIYIFQLIETYRYLLGSIDLLVNNQLIHNSLNDNTIVVFKDKPILTNFRNSIDLLNPAFNWSQYFLQIKLNRFFPVVFYLLQYQLTNSKVLSAYNIETIIKQFVKDHLSFVNENANINTDFKYYNRYTNKTFDENLTEALKYWKTWDNYALSMVYLDLLKNTSVKDNKFISYFMKLLVDNISLDPSKRNQTNKSLDLFEEMLQSLDLKDFRELIRKAI